MSVLIALALRALLGKTSNMNKNIKPKVPTFEVFKRNGRLKPHLRRAFIEQVNINELDWLLNIVTMRDGSDWNVVFEDNISSSLFSEKESIKCIASCQEDWQGNKIAVVRLYKDKEGQNGTNIS